MNVTKDWLGYENQRNKLNAATYTTLLKLALKHVDCAVLIGHHITFELDGDLETENEIPSADCLMFDHEIMRAVFGDSALRIMRELVVLPCDQRDKLLKWHVDQVHDPLTV